MSVIARPADPADPDSVRLDDIAAWLDIVTDPSGREHAVLSDGWRHVRLDVEEGRLTGQTAVLLDYRISGRAKAEANLPTLGRFLALCRHRRFVRSLFPPDPRIGRGILTLRVQDALSAGASQRDIASALYGGSRIAAEWNGPSDSLRSRVRRLVGDARRMAAGGYRLLMRRR